VQSFDSLFPDILKVEIGLLYDLPIATSVATEPLTPDDWEILVNALNTTSGYYFTFLSRNYTQNT
jgi:hypothetical protein